MNLSKYRYRLADIGRAFRYAFGRSLPHPNDAGRHGVLWKRAQGGAKAMLKAAVWAAVMIGAGMATAFSEDEAGRAKLAEMMAFLREAPDVCPASPVTDAGGSDVLALYMSLGDKAPSEDEIEAKQAYLQALLKKMGKAKWCQLRVVEMGEAQIIVEMRERAGQ